ncbi:MAG: hypothetical protein JSR49_16015 [Proteobacteria bacterium]|nr:hypothetical protein [Pseudomonadota bacterium]
MRSEYMQIVVLEKYPDVLPYLADVVRWGDSDKTALGFLPTQVYGVQARKGNCLSIHHRAHSCPMLAQRSSLSATTSALNGR